jgi:uncharacterized membrane protein
LHKVALTGHRNHMSTDQEKIDQLKSKLDDLMLKHEQFRNEIIQLRNELNLLHAPTKPQISQQQQVSPVSEISKLPKQEVQVFPSRKIQWQSKELIAIKSDLERFIGENLINKIGILIILIGVVIGAKYAIDKDLISPLTRVIFGYMLGASLLLIAIKLKNKYENFSAVILGGAMAIFYFISFAAYSYYNLIGIPIAFSLMLLFTVFTVFAALNYNKQIIAHFGLVAAYAVPFLVSDKSGNVSNLFSYMLIINIGILAISVKKLWKPLYYLSFGSSWLILALWFLNDFNAEDHFTLMLVFSTLFFLIFYIVFLAYKIIRNEKFEALDIVILLINSFIFYGLNYSSFDEGELTQNYIGLFTIGNAVIHFIVSIILYRRKLDDTNLLNLVSGLVLVFLTVTIPVQLSGKWVTVLWATEAALLFWIGRTRQITFYELISYPLIILAFISFIDDYTTLKLIYGIDEEVQQFTPIINTRFLSAFIFIAAFALINLIHNKEEFLTEKLKGHSLYNFMNFSIPAILILTIYISMRTELADYWQYAYAKSKISIQDSENNYAREFYNHDLLGFSKVWIINYTLLFLSILSYFNIKKIKNAQLGFINIILNSLALLIFLTQGLYTLSFLRDSYLSQNLSEYYHQGWFHVGLRYISYLFVGLILITTYHYCRQVFIQSKFKLFYSALLHITLLWIASSELINLMDLLKSAQSYKLGLSILWGTYALLLVALGIAKKQTYLRIGGIVLFSITLLKLFLYDISDLNTIAKTIVFVVLGVLLLIISFLYNKYKNYLKEENEI